MKFNLYKFTKTNYHKVFGVVAFLVLLFAYARIFAIGSPYQPGLTLDPACIPGEVNCFVQIIPSQTGNNGKFLTTNGTVTSWGNAESPLTFSTGLTRTANTITSNLSTGVAGGQSVVGGTVAGNNLTLSSTTNGTKGKILFGTSAYDEVNNRLGIGTSTPTDRIDLIGNMKLSGSILLNSLSLTGFGTRSFSVGAGTPTVTDSFFFGQNAGVNATNASFSNFMGVNAGINATSAYYSNFMGLQAGNGATSANNSNFFGQNAGVSATNASFSNLFGYHTGYNPGGNNIGSNNIIIGTNISLPDTTANAINIGGVLFGKGSYSNTGGDPSTTPVIGGKIGIGTNNPIAQLHVAGEVPGDPISFVSAGVDPTSVYIQGHYAYIVSNGDRMMTIVDISNPSSMTVVSSTDVVIQPSTIYVQGKYAYVDAAGAAFRIYDVSNPVAPVYVGQVNLSYSGSSSLYVQGRYAYVVFPDQNLLDIYDISNPAASYRIGTVSTITNPILVSVSGRYAYVGEADSSFEILDISNPAYPLSVGSVSVDGKIRSLYVQDRYAYVGTDANVFEIIDIHDPSSPTIVNTISTSATALSLYVQGRYAYVGTSSNGIRFYDVSNPSANSFIGSISLSGKIASISVKGRYLYALTDDNRMYVYDIGGAYIQQLESGGLETGTLSVKNNLQALDGDFRGGLTVGQSLNVSGGLAVGSYFRPGGDTSITSALRIEPNLIGADFGGGQQSLYGIYTVPKINLSGGSSDILTNLYGNYQSATIDNGTVNNWYANYVAAPIVNGNLSSRYAFVSEDGAGNVGIGTTTPGSLFTVGADAFMVNSGGIVSAGTWNGSTINQAYLGSGGGGSSKFLREDNTWQTVTTGTVTGTGTANSMTKWTGTSSIGNSLLQDDGFILSATVQPVTTNGFALTASTVATGNLVSFTNTGTAAAGNTKKVLAIASSGANGTASQTVTGQTILVTNTGTTNTNVGLNVTASGATNNYAALFTGNVGIGTTSPDNLLHIKSASSPSEITFETSGSTKGYTGLNSSGTMQLAINRNIGGSISNASAATASININGTNANSSIVFYTSSTNNVAGTERWRIDKDGNLITGTDNVYDIGASGATRPRTGYFGTSIQVDAPSNSIYLLNLNRASAGGNMFNWGEAGGVNGNWGNGSYLFGTGSNNTKNFTVYTYASGGATQYGLNIIADTTGASNNALVRIAESTRINAIVGATTDTFAKFTVSGSTTAASAIARSTYLNGTVVAAANNDVLVGLDIAPTFTNGGFTGVSDVALRTVTGNVLLGTTSGNVGIGTASPTAAKLVVSNSATGSSFNITNPSNSTSFNISVGDTGNVASGQVGLSGGGNGFILSSSRISFNTPVLTTGQDIQTFKIYGGYSAANIGNSIYLSSNTGSGGNFTATSGTQNTVTLGTAQNDVLETWQPSSGTATYNMLNITQGVNTSGSYSGTVRSIYVNPTLTSLTGTSYRALELAGNGGFGVYQSGASATNYFAGNVGIGTTSPHSKLEIATGAVDDTSFYQANIWDAYNARINGGNLSLFSTGGASSAGDSYQLSFYGRYNNSGQGWQTNKGGYIRGGAVNGAMIGGQPSGQGKLVLGTTTTDYSGAVTRTDADTMTLTSGNVGIGTTSPGAKLDVSDATQSQINITKTGAGAGHIDIINDGTYPRMFGPSGSNFYLGVTGDAVGAGLTLKAGGNVGIGTTSPAQKLHILGSNSVIQIESTSAYAGTVLKTASGANTGYVVLDSSTSPAFGVNDALVLWNNSGPMFFATNNAERMRLDTLGRLGIGTASPDTKLTVSGDAFIGKGSSNTWIQVGGSYGSGTLSTSPAYFGRYANEVQITSGGSVMPINLQAPTVYTTGNFGVGTASPSSLFSVGSGSLLQVNTSGDIFGSQTTLDGSTTANGAGTASTTLILTSGTNFDVGNYVQVSSTNCVTGVNICYAKITAKSTDTLTISPALTWANSSAVVEIHIPEVGGINLSQALANRYGRGYFIDGVVTGNGSTYFTDGSISSTSATFNLLGDTPSAVTALNIGKSTTVTTLGGALKLTGLSTDALTIGIPGVLCLNNSNEVVKLTGVATCIVSSREFKDNIVDIGHGLDWVNALRPVTFDFKSDHSPSLGFIAEEVDQVTPLLSARDQNGKVFSVRYELMAPVLVKAIQEMDIKIKGLSSLDTTDSNSMGAMIKNFLGNIGNSIEVVFFGEVHTKKLCLDDVCITKAELQQLLNSQNINTPPSSGGSGGAGNGNIGGGTNGNSGSTVPTCTLPEVLNAGGTACEAPAQEPTPNPEPSPTQ